jgi:heptosyltransferase-2
LSSSLVVQTSFLGDTVLTTPLIAALAERGPVDVVTTPAAAPLLANNPAVRAVLAYDKRGADAGIGGMLRLAARLRAARYDAAYLAQGSWRSAAVAALARIPVRVGFDTSAGRWLCTDRVPYRREWHHAERVLSLAGDDARRHANHRPQTATSRTSSGATASPGPDRLRPRLYPGPAEQAAVDALLAPLPRDGAALLALAPGSVWETKRWPHFPALAARLAPVYRIVVIGSAADTPLVADIARAAGPERVLDVTGRLSLLGSAELLSRCAALVTNDSAPLHVASAMDVPTVAVFGPTVPAFGFGPLASRAAVAELTGLPCRPCDAHGPRRCPLGHWKCMRDLDAARVLDAALEVARATGS